jgi:hypothetical protein
MTKRTNTLMLFINNFIFSLPLLCLVLFRLSVFILYRLYLKNKYLFVNFFRLMVGEDEYHEKESHEYCPSKKRMVYGCFLNNSR